MQFKNSQLGVSITRPESERFGVPLLLIHGLWTGSWLWSRFDGYLGHRGWEVWAVDLPGRSGAADEGEVSDAEGLVACCERVVAEMSSPPVIVGHDAGASIALRLAAAIEAPAVVLAAPAIPGSGAMAHAFSGLGRTLRSMLGQPLDPPVGQGARAYFGDEEPSVAKLVMARLVPESGRAAYDLLRGRLDPVGMANRPTLIIGGSTDRVTPPVRLEAVAHELSAACIIAEGGHWFPIGNTWRETANSIHRWIVRTLGESLLLFRDEDEDEEAS